MTHHSIMSRFVKILIALVLIAVIVGLIVLLLYGRRGGLPLQEAPLVVAPSTQVQAEVPQEAVPSIRASVPDAEAGQSSLPRETSLAALARSFVERYGSYSNQSDFENIEVLYPFMTDRMRAAAEASTAANRANRVPGSADSYTGITTKALAIKVRSQTVSAAQVQVSTQRIESNIKTSSPRVYYQDIILTFEYKGGEWKVDEAEWK